MFAACTVYNDVVMMKNGEITKLTNIMNMSQLPDDIIRNMIIIGVFIKLQTHLVQSSCTVIVTILVVTTVFLCIL